MSWLERISTKMKNGVARGVTNLVDCAGDIRRVQASFFGDTDTLDNMPAPQEYGHASYPPAGLPNITLFPAGDRSGGLVIMVVDNQYRIELEEGDVALYDHRGQSVHLTKDGIDLTTAKRIRLRCQDYELHASRSVLTSVGGYADKLTHVSEGQLVSETWHEPAVVTALPDKHYKLPQGGADV